MTDFFWLATIISSLGVFIWLFKLAKSVELQTGIAIQAPEKSKDKPADTEIRRGPKSTREDSELLDDFYDEAPAPVSSAPQPKPEKWRFVFGGRAKIKPADKKQRAQNVQLHGRANLPHKVYEGDSKNIKIDLQPLEKIFPTHPPPLQVKESDDGLSLTLTLPSPTGPNAQIEFELIAAGFEIGGETKQRQVLASNMLRYQWNCYFPNSGSHDFTLVARLINSRRAVEIGRLERAIRVVKLDHLTQRQVWTLATLAGIVSGGLAIAKILKELRVW